MSREPQAGDITINRNVGLSGTTFTLFRFPSVENINGVVYPSEDAAREAALTIAKERGVDVWLESAVEPLRFHCLTA